MQTKCKWKKTLLCRFFITFAHKSKSNETVSNDIGRMPPAGLHFK